jgi:parallel beta-helix repeat protein
VKQEVVVVFLVGLALFTSHDFEIAGLNRQVPQQLVLVSQSQSVPWIVIVGNAQLAPHSSGGSGTESDPYLISGLIFPSASISYVHIYNTTAFFIVENVILESLTYVEDKILLDNVENGRIENCHIRGGDVCVKLVNCTDCIVSDTTCIGAAYSGILIETSDSCTIQKSIMHSNVDGVLIRSSSGTLVVNSSIYRNKRTGLSIEFNSENTVVYNNRFGWNPTNAYNDGNNTEFTNIFDTGNAWSDYIGFGAYLIPGSMSIADMNPITFIDTAKPIITSPDDTVFDADSIGNTLTWSAYDDTPYSYQLFVEDMPYHIEIWDGSEITASLDGLPAGVFTMVINVSDAAGNWAIDDVVIDGVNFMLGSIDMGLIVLASALTVVMFIALVILIRKIP